MLDIGELFCRCVLRQFLLFVEVLWSEMFVFFLDSLLSVSVKFLFLCVCVCVIQKSWTNNPSISNNLYCAITVDTQYPFLLWKSPPLNWVSFIIFLKRCQLRNHPHDDDDDEDQRIPSSVLLLLLQQFFWTLESSVYCVCRENEWQLIFRSTRSWIHLLLCHKENTSIVAIWVLIRTHECESNAKQAGKEREKNAQPKSQKMEQWQYFSIPI